MNCCFEFSVLLDFLIESVLFPCGASSFDLVFKSQMFFSPCSAIYWVKISNSQMCFAMFSHLLSQDIKLSDVETLPIRVCEDQGQNHLASNLTGVPKKLIVNTPHTQRQPVFRAGGFWLNKQNVKKWSNIAPLVPARGVSTCVDGECHIHILQPIDMGKPR